MLLVILLIYEGEIRFWIFLLPPMQQSPEEDEKDEGDSASEDVSDVGKSSSFEGVKVCGFNFLIKFRQFH